MHERFLGPAFALAVSGMVGVAAISSALTPPRSGGSIGAGPALDCVTGADLEASGTVVISDCRHGIRRVDPQTGDRSIVSDETTGVGPVFESPADVAVEGTGTLLVADLSSVKRVDPTSGARTIVAAAPGGGFRDARSIAVEVASTALVSDRGRLVIIPFGRFGYPLFLFAGVVRIDLDTGTGVVVSGGGLGSGMQGRGRSFLFTPPGPIAVGAAGTAAVIKMPDVLSNKQDLLRVDLVTGDRKRVRQFDPGSVPPYTLADVKVDGSGSWFAVDQFRAVVRVDPATGAVSTVSGPCGEAVRCSNGRKRSWSSRAVPCWW